MLGIKLSFPSPIQKKWEIYLSFPFPIPKVRNYIFSRPGRSQGLLNKQPRDYSLIKSVILFLPKLYGAVTPKRTSSYKIDFVIAIKNFLNPEGHQNPISGSKVTALLLKWLI